VRNWLTHGTEVGKHQQLKPTKVIAGLKLIDVHTNCVVVGPADCRYMALSYVWGNASQYRVQSADFVVGKYGAASLETLHARLDIKKLPRTIRDAMFLVKTVGERFLWVDCLCIMQDDNEEMKTMIHAMDEIYKAALFTIIAASGEDSEAGLPGLKAFALLLLKRGWTMSLRSQSGRLVVGLTKSITFLRKPCSLLTKECTSKKVLKHGAKYNQLVLRQACTVFIQPRILVFGIFTASM
jgi:hypothetical protein